MSEVDFISAYLRYTKETECPPVFHRWTAIASLSAYLGRRTYFNHGHFTIHPNLYVMLMGSPGTKKSSAIKIGAKLLRQAGYTNFAAKKTRQEKFLSDLAELADRAYARQQEEGEDNPAMQRILESNIFGDGDITEPSTMYETRPPAEVMVAADEFNNFIGLNNLDFISILGELWDYEGVYDYKLRNADSIYIPNPTVTILGGNTATGFNQAFPVEAIGQGFFSRLMLIHGEPTGVKYTFPPEPCPELQQTLVDILKDIKRDVAGACSLTPAARDLLEYIYHNWKPLNDSAFEHYSNRRLTHLLKLCIVHAASSCTTVIDDEVVIRANTILSHAEYYMPDAMGEFGAARNSLVAHKVIQTINAAEGKVQFLQLWQALHKDIDSRESLIKVVSELTQLGKIAMLGDGWIPVNQPLSSSTPDAVDWGYLTESERGDL